MPCHQVLPITHVRLARHTTATGPSEVALAWLLAQPGVTAPIIGPRTEEQLTQAVLGLDVQLGDAELVRLDQIFPGPGGAAPEAYAW